MTAPKIIFVDNLASALLNQRWPLIRAVQEAGFAVAVAVPQDERCAELTARGVQVHPWSVVRRGLGPISELSTLLALKQLFKRERPMLVHVRSPKPVMYGGIAARFAGVPAVVSHVTGLGIAAQDATGWRARMAGLGLRALAGPAFGHPHQRVIVQNRDDVEAVAKLGCDPKRIRLIRGSGVDPDAFTPREPVPGDPLIVLPSRMLFSKGVAVFVAAAEILRAAGVRARFALVGPLDLGNPDAVPEAQLLAWNAAGVVAWWGERHDMPAVYAEAAIVCLPSWYREGLPKTLLEGMASGLPIVTCDSIGCREAISDGVHGFLVPPRDALALATALRRLIESPELRARCGAAGRAQVLAEFAAAPIAAKTLAVLREVVEESGQKWPG